MADFLMENLGQGESSLDLATAGTSKGRHATLFVWLPMLLLVAFIGVSLWHSFAQHRADTERQTQIIARAVEEHATATIERASLGLLSIVERVHPADLDRNTLSSQQQRHLTAMLVAQHQAMRGVVSMSLTDTEGIVIANSVGTPPGVDLGQRRYFRELKAGHPGDIAIFEVIKGKVSNKWGLQVARRIDRPDGSFGGIVVANLGLQENFEHFYKNLGLSARGLITLRDADNTILVRYPMVESMLGKTIDGSQGARAVSEQVNEQTFRSVSPIDGVDRITALRKLPDYPVYVLVGQSYEEMVWAWAQGASTQILMGLLIVLQALATSLILLRRFDMMQELKALSVRLKTSNRELVEANAQIERQSFQDQLTGAWNRRFADLRLREALAKSEREGRPFSLLLMDIDHFKSINDRWGHQVGDMVLSEFVESIQKRLRVNDLLFRWGGEEFMLLLEGSEIEAASILAEQLRRSLELHGFPTVGQLTVSIGVAQFRRSESLHELMRRTDMALYSAKHAGRNRVARHDGEAVQITAGQPA